MNKELSRYIIKYYGGLLTESEAKAYRHIISMSKLGWLGRRNKKRLKEYEKDGLISTDPKILKLTENGNDIFFKKTAKRILKEHNENVFINSCTNCGRLARTPNAKQCRHCGNKWFDA